MVCEDVTTKVGIARTVTRIESFVGQELTLESTVTVKVADKAGETTKEALVDPLLHK